MAHLTQDEFKKKYNRLFADNQLQKIDEVVFRSWAADIADSFALSVVSVNVPDWLEGTYYPTGYTILHSFGGPKLFMQAVLDGNLEEPTDPLGDANWAPALAPAPDNATYQLATVPALRLAVGKWVPGRLYLLQNRTDLLGQALPDVCVRALSADQLEPEAWRLDTGMPERVHYDLSTDTADPVRTASAFADLEGEPNDNAALASELASKADLVGGKVPAAQLPAYVDDVIEADTFTALPAVGERGKIYITTDNNKQYRWGGTLYVEIGKSIAIYTSTGSAVDGAMNQKAATAEYLKYLPLAGNGTNGLPMRGAISWGASSLFALSNTLFLQNASYTLQLAPSGLILQNSNSGGQGSTLDSDEDGDLYLNSLRIASFFDCRTRDITARRISPGTLVYTNAAAVYICYNAAPVGTAEPTDTNANYIKLFGTSSGAPSGSGYTDEQAQDAFAALLAQGVQSGIKFTYDDAGNKLNVEVTASAPAGAPGSFGGLSGLPTDNVELAKSLRTLASILPATTYRGDYTLQLEDAGCLIPCASANGISDITVPADEDVNFPIGTIMEVSQENNATVTIRPGVGSVSGTVVVLEAYLNALSTAGQYAAVGLRKVAANRWRVTGGAQ